MKNGGSANRSNRKSWNQETSRELLLQTIFKTSCPIEKGVRGIPQQASTNATPACSWYSNWTYVMSLVESSHPHCINKHHHPVFYLGFNTTPSSEIISSINVILLNVLMLISSTIVTLILAGVGIWHEKKTDFAPRLSHTHVLMPHPGNLSSETLHAQKDLCFWELERAAPTSPPKKVPGCKEL